MLQVDTRVPSPPIPRRLWDQLAQHDIRRIHVTPLAHGSQASSYRVHRPGESEQWVLKVLRPDRMANTPSVVDREFWALRTFGDAVEGLDHINSPRAIEGYPTELAYLMSFVQGRPLQNLLTTPMPRRQQQQLAQAIVDGLRIYHTQVGQVYGDLNAKNILVEDDGTVGFLDPSPTNLLQEWLSVGEDASLMTADLGYWVYAATVQSPVQMLNGSSVPYGLHRLTDDMIHRAFHGDPDPTTSVRAVFAAAIAHADRLGERDRFKDKILASITRTILRGHRRRILRKG